MHTENKKANPSIECTVNQCRYHHGEKNYCSLDRIRVVTHESDPKMEQCTDCDSFKPKTMQTTF